MAKSQVVVVRAGYGGKGLEPDIWGYLHFHPTREEKPGIVKLAYVDFYGRKLRVWNEWQYKRSKAAPQSPDLEIDLEPKVQTREPDGSLVTDDPKPSVLALYNYVREQPASSIVGFHVFSHSYDTGLPVIWNSYERFSGGDEPISDDDLTVERDPHDTDCRPRDFFGSNPLNGTNGAQFRAAFAGNAFVKLWGCSSDDDIRDRVFRIARAKDKKSEYRRAEIYSYLTTVNGSFPMRLSRLLTLPVWSPPIGWGSNPWFHKNLPYAGRFPPDLNKENWWQVPGFRKAIEPQRFFKELGAPIDATFYIGYSTRWFDNALARFAPQGSQPKSPVSTPKDLQDTLILRGRELE